ncbi:SpoIIE family protein phosphatase [Desulfomonile tiedjei]|nr:SpoIIE family protein phosphatase [Desulfomonile tiedjei]
MYLNFDRRSFKWPGVAGARVRAGSCPGQGATGTGDCVLLNFETGVFAVSDSSERDPGQSKAFLLHFDNLVSEISRETSALTKRTLEFAKVAEKINLGCEKIMQATQGTASCTFTGMNLLKTSDGLTALLFHTGDSRLYQYDRLQQTARVLTENNFWMIGKTVKLFQTAVLTLKPDSILIFATDGVSQGMDEPAQKRELTEIIRCNEVEDIPDRIMHTDSTAQGFRDDAAVIALATRGLQYVNARIIMGGTTAYEEKAYAERCRSTYPLDSYVCVTETSSRIDHVF